MGRRVGCVLVLGNSGDSLDDGLRSHSGSVPAATDAGQNGEEEEEHDDGDDPVPVEVLFAESASDAVGAVGTIGGAGAPVDALLEVDDGALREVGVDGRDGGGENVAASSEVPADGVEGVRHCGRV